MSPSPFKIEPGARLGPYEVEGEIGRGGMGAILRARHVDTRALHAVKVVLAHRLAPHARLHAVARFAREAEALARVDRHPGLVRVFGCGEERGTPWCAMELIAGRSLGELLDEGPLAPDAAARLVRDVALAIEHVHAHGIVHRDIKPDNILIDEAGDPRVVDFGIALDDAAEERLTETGAAVGSPLFMAPEQLRGDRGKIVPATDVFGLGGLLYVALTGRAPFAGHAGVALVAAILRGAPPALERVHGAVPSPLSAICRRALAREVDDRYPSAQAMAADLDRWLRGESVDAVPSALSGVGRRWRSLSRPARFASGLVLATLLALAVAAVAGRGGADPRRAVRELETALAARGWLSDSERARLRRLASDAAADATTADGEELAARIRVVELTDAIVVRSAETPEDELARSLALALRPGGAVRRPLLDLAEGALRRRGRFAELAVVLHGAEPVVVASPLSAASLARATADSDAAPMPLDDRPFGALYHAAGLDDATRGRLLERRGRIALTRGADGFELALRCFSDALRSHGVGPRPGWPAAFHTFCHGAFIERHRESPEAGWAIVDVLARAEHCPVDLPVDVIAALQLEVFDGFGGVVAERKTWGRERSLALAVFLEVVDASMFHGPLTMAKILKRVGAEWARERAEAELARRERANPQTLAMLASVLASGEGDSELVSRLSRAAVEVAGPVDVHARTIVGWLRHSLGDESGATTLLEGALAADRAAPIERRHSAVAIYAAEVRLALPRRHPDRGGLEAIVDLVLEAHRVRLASEERCARITAVEGVAPWILEQGGPLWIDFENLVHERHGHGPARCCPSARPTVDELLTLLGELAPVVRGYELRFGERSGWQDLARAAHRRQHETGVAAPLPHPDEFRRQGR